MEPSSTTTGTCGWCGRLDREVRPCCEGHDHDTMVCTDSRDCLAAIQAAESAAGVREHAAAAETVTAELAARRTAAAAVLGDFRHATNEYATGALVNPDWLAWAMRLSAELSGLLAAEGAR